MRASDMSGALTALLPTLRPVFLWGPPGIGKSSLVRQSATALGLDVCDIRAVLYALVGALVERARSATDPHLNALATFAGRMSAEYGTLLIRDTIAVNPRAWSQQGVANWVRQHADLFATR